MAIDDNTSYELTGAQVKDLASKINAKADKMVVYANDSMHSPELITGLFSDSGLTTPADPSDMSAVIDNGGVVVVKYSTDEVVVITSCDDHAGQVPDITSYTGQFIHNWKTNSPQFIKFEYDNTTYTWTALSKEMPAPFGGATSADAGTSGLVPAPAAGDQDKVLKGDGSWASQPTVNDATLTIQKNGTDVQTFTANQSTNATANIIVPTQFSDLSGTVGTSQIADGAVTPAKLARGSATLVYYDTSAVTVTDATYSALKSGTITTNGGDIFVSGFVYGTKSGGGVTYLYAKIDNTEYKLSQTSVNGNMSLFASQIITGISAGTHTVSFAVTTQSGSGRSYTVSGYCQDWMTFIEI